MAEYDATDATLRRLARKRKMAELLQAQSMKGLELPNPNAPASYLNALGVLGEAYFGKKRGDEADAEDTKYEASQDEGRNKAIDSIKKFFGVGDETGTPPAQPTTPNEPVSLRDSIESAMPKEQAPSFDVPPPSTLGGQMAKDQVPDTPIPGVNTAPPPFADKPLGFGATDTLGGQMAAQAPLDYKPNPKRTFGSESDNAIGQLANYPGAKPSLGDWMNLDQTASPESPEMPKMLPAASKAAPAPMVPKPVTAANVALPGNAFGGGGDPTKGAFVNVSGTPEQQAKAHADIAAAMQKDKISGPVQYSPPPPGGGLPQATPPPPAALAAGAAPLPAAPAAPAPPAAPPAPPMGGSPAAGPSGPAGGPIPLVPRTNPSIAPAAPPVPKRPMVPSPVDFLTAIQQMPPGYAKNQMFADAYKNVLSMPEKHDARLMHEETIRAAQAQTAAIAGARINSSERNTDVNAEKALRAAAVRSQQTGGPTVLPGDPSLRGQAYLASIEDPFLHGQVEGALTGEINVKAMSKKNNQQAVIDGAAKLVDPNYHAGRFEVAQKFRNPDSKIGGQIQSLNMVLGHMSTLQDLFDAQANGDMTAANAIANAWNRQFGNGESVNTAVGRQAVATEMMKLMRGAGAGSVKEVEEWLAALPANASVAVQSGALQTGAKLVGSRLNSFNDAYRRGMNLDKDVPGLLSDEAQAALRRFGYQPHGAGGGLTGDPLVDKYLKK